MTVETAYLLPGVAPWVPEPTAKVDFRTVLGSAKGRLRKFPTQNLPLVL
jgi:hypothetical protein